MKKLLVILSPLVFVLAGCDGNAVQTPVDNGDVVVEVVDECNDTDADTTVCN